MKAEKQEQILACMAEVLNQNGFRAEVMRSDSAPTLLRCEAMRQGKVAKDVVIECCFIPMQLPGEESGLLAAGARWSVRDFRELRIVREDDRLYCQHRHPATTGSERSVGVP